MKIYVAAALHGDELFGLKVIGRLRRNSINTITVRIGHPEAIAKHRRYLEDDLNRSFANEKKTLEATIARRIRKEMVVSKSDLILDIHTSTTNVGKVAILARRGELIERAAQILGMEAVVIMPEHLTKSSLIGCFPDKSISLEFGKNKRSDKLANEIAQKIEALGRTCPEESNRLPVFKVYAQIDKNFGGLSTIKNLQFNKELNGYPFLAGTNAYETIGGFLARKVN